VISSINIFFTAIFFFEAVMKIVGLGWKFYFRDPWNIFDFVIVITSILTISLDKAVSV
jgi:voltage-gated sodium channel type IV alpha